MRITSQEGWPFENAIRGVVTREDMGTECDCDRKTGEPHDDECQAFAMEKASTRTEYKDGLQAKGVFIVEGRQERFGNKRAWEVV